MRDVRSEKLPTDAQSNTLQIESKKARNTFPALLGPLFMVLILSGCQHTTDQDNGGGGNTPGEPPPGYQEFPRWSPDGQTILYYSHGLMLYDPANNRALHNPDSVGIWAMNSDGTNRRKLLSGGYADWGPQGKWIVFERGAQIFKARFNGQTVDTSSMEQLTAEGRNFFPAWSPDGQWIAYNESICNGPGTCGIWIMSANSTKHKFIADYGDYPDWNPSGLRIAFFRGIINSSGNFLGDSLWTYNLNNLALDCLTFKGGDNRYPKYSPDGEKIAFESNAQLWIMNADGSQPKKLVDYNTGRMPDWSPDGRQIVFIGPKMTIWIMNADGSNPHPVTFRPEGTIPEN